VGAKRVGARELDEVKLIMVQSTNSDLGRIKKDFGGQGSGGNRSIDEIYTPAFSRARGVY
jgi:hypothetical protein